MRGFRSSISARGIHSAFTLIELLVVIGIIAALIAILIPTLALARRSANEVKCRSNMRQIGLAMLNYAAENKGKFPPNIDHWPGLSAGDPNWFVHWCDVDRIGRYLSGYRKSQIPNYNFANHVVGGVMVCPDDDQGISSYAMNYFASSAVKIDGRIGPPNYPKAGQPWSANVKQSSQMILLTEQLSHNDDGTGGYMCWAVLPMMTQQNEPTFDTVRFYPGIEFVGRGTSIGETNSGRYWPREVEIDYARHRQRGDRGKHYTDPRGRANFAFADGHVACFSADDLAHRTGPRRSKLVALWSPIDAYVDRLPRTF